MPSPVRTAARTFELEGFSATVKRLTDEDYRDLHARSVPIDDANLFWHFLTHPINSEEGTLSLAELAFTLAQTYGPTSEIYDDWKGSFEYPFRLDVHKERGQFPYVFTVNDWRGCVEFPLSRIVPTRKETASNYHPPYEDEFPRSEINYFTAFFYGYLTGRFEALREAGLQPQPFARKVDSNHILYGYLPSGFFNERYEGEEAFSEAVERLRKLVPSQAWHAAPAAEWRTRG